MPGEFKFSKKIPHKKERYEQKVEEQIDLMDSFIEANIVEGGKATPTMLLKLPKDQIDEKKYPFLGNIIKKNLEGKIEKITNLGLNDLLYLMLFVNENKYTFRDLNLSKTFIRNKFRVNKEAQLAITLETMGENNPVQKMGEELEQNLENWIKYHPEYAEAALDCIHDYMERKTQTGEIESEVMAALENTLKGNLEEARKFYIEKGLKQKTLEQKVFMPDEKKKVITGNINAYIKAVKKKLATRKEIENGDFNPTNEYIQKVFTEELLEKIKYLKVVQNTETYKNLLDKTKKEILKKCENGKLDELMNNLDGVPKVDKETKDLLTAINSEIIERAELIDDIKHTTFWSDAVKKAKNDIKYVEYCLNKVDTWSLKGWHERYVKKDEHVNKEELSLLKERYAKYLKKDINKSEYLFLMQETNAYKNLSSSDEKEVLKKIDKYTTNALMANLKQIPIIDEKWKGIFKEINLEVSNNAKFMGTKGKYITVPIKKTDSQLPADVDHLLKLGSSSGEEKEEEKDVNKHDIQIEKWGK